VHDSEKNVYFNVRRKAALTPPLYVVVWWVRWRGASQLVKVVFSGVSEKGACLGGWGPKGNSVHTFGVVRILSRCLGTSPKILEVPSKEGFWPLGRTRRAQPDRYTHLNAPKKMATLSGAAQRRCSAQTPPPTVFWVVGDGEGWPLAHLGTVALPPCRGSSPARLLGDHPRRCHASLTLTKMCRRTPILSAEVHVPGRQEYGDWGKLKVS
jgi:hypothetical protein